MRLNCPLANRRRYNRSTPDRRTACRCVGFCVNVPCQWPCRPAATSTSLAGPKTTLRPLRWSVRPHGQFLACLFAVPRRTVSGRLPGLLLPSSFIIAACTHAVLRPSNLARHCNSFFRPTSFGGAFSPPGDRRSHRVCFETTALRKSDSRHQHCGLFRAQPLGDVS